MEDYLKVLESFQNLNDDQKFQFFESIRTNFSPTATEQEFLDVELMQQRAHLATQLQEIHNDDGTHYFKPDWIATNILKITI